MNIKQIIETWNKFLAIKAPVLKEKISDQDFSALSAFVPDVCESLQKLQSEIIPKLISALDSPNVMDSTLFDPLFEMRAELNHILAHTSCANVSLDALEYLLAEAPEEKARFP